MFDFSKHSIKFKNRYLLSFWLQCIEFFSIEFAFCLTVKMTNYSLENCHAAICSPEHCPLLINPRNILPMENYFHECTHGGLSFVTINSSKAQFERAFLTLSQGNSLNKNVSLKSVPKGDWRLKNCTAQKFLKSRNKLCDNPSRLMKKSIKIPKNQPKELQIIIKHDEKASKV